MHYGDSGAAIKYKDGSVKKIDNPNEAILEKLDNAVLARMKEIAMKENKNVTETKDYPEIKEMLAANRAKKNTNDRILDFGDKRRGGRTWSTSRGMC